MPNNHQHKCDHGCKHKRVKYCDKCQKCYCLDCGMEWPQQQGSTIYTYTVVVPASPSVPWYVPRYPLDPCYPVVTCDDTSWGCTIDKGEN
jgi:hypothetical protein